MRLVVDANILVAELLRRRGRQLVEDQRLDLLIASEAQSEAEHELRKRVAAIERAHRVSPELARDLLTNALETVTRRVVRVPAAEYSTLESTARRRIPRDPDDWPTVALALAIGAGIWTQDADFLGCGVATWTTETLLNYLEENKVTVVP